MSKICTNKSISSMPGTCKLGFLFLSQSDLSGSLNLYFSFCFNSALASGFSAKVSDRIFRSFYCPTASKYLHLHLLPSSCLRGRIILESSQINLPCIYLRPVACSQLPYPFLYGLSIPNKARDPSSSHSITFTGVHTTVPLGTYSTWSAVPTTNLCPNLSLWFFFSW